MGFFNKDERKQDPQTDSKKEQTASQVRKPEARPVVKGSMKANVKKQGDAPGAGGESIIAEGTVMNGDIQSDRTVIVYGTVKGKVHIQSDLIVAESGLVEADVNAENVSIAGRKKGRTEARNLFELKKTGTIEGEIVAKSVKIDEGGRVIGKINMQTGAPQATKEIGEAEIKKKKELLRGDADAMAEKNRGA